MSKASRQGTMDYPEFPDVQEEIGENPARYLLEPNETTYAVIRGISDPDRLDAWFRVEEELGPRKKVLQALNDQREAIRE